MKVLFISEYFPPKIMGGGEINVNLLAKALVKNKVEVFLLTSYHPGLKKVEIVDGIKVYRTLKTATDPHSIINNLKRSIDLPKSIVKEVNKIVKKYNFDAIHFIGTSIIAAQKLKKLKIPLFATIESFPTLCPKGDRFYHGKKECSCNCSFFKYLFCQMNSNEMGKVRNKFYLKYNLLSLAYVYNYYRRLNKSLHYCNLVAISEYVKKILFRQSLDSKVIPNALDTKKYNLKGCSKKYLKDTLEKHSEKSAEKIKPKKIKILYLGSLTKFKGPQILLRALKGLDCHADFYGEGPLKKEMLNGIKRYGLDAQIHNPVPYPKIPEIYANADIVAFPSAWPEPFGRIAIESMAAGKPVIGSNIGAIKELIAKGAGILVKPGDVDELRKAIKKLIQNPKLRENMGKIGVKAAQEYDEENTMKKIKIFYLSKQ